MECQNQRSSAIKCLVVDSKSGFGCNVSVVKVLQSEHKVISEGVEFKVLGKTGCIGQEVTIFNPLLFDLNSEMVIISN